VPGSPLVDPADELRTIAALLEAANHDGGAAAAVLDETAEVLGEGIADLVNAFNPEVVVLGGWVSVRLGGYMLPKIKRVVEDSALAAPRRATRVVLGQLHDDAVAMGAATLAVEVFFANAGQLRTRSGRATGAVMLNYEATT
jgi:predicted NBD/HSP70 family sugar kinase